MTSIHPQTATFSYKLERRFRFICGYHDITLTGQKYVVAVTVNQPLQEQNVQLPITVIFMDLNSNLQSLQKFLGMCLNARCRNSMDFVLLLNK